MSRLDTGRKSKYHPVLQERGKNTQDSNCKILSMVKVQYHTVSKLISQEKTMPNMEYFVHYYTEIHDAILTSCLSQVL